MKRDNPMNLPPLYAEARKLPGLMRVTLRNGDQAWLVTRYEDIRELMSNRAFSAMPTRPGYPFVSESLRGLLTGERPTFVSMDGAEHLRFRRMLAPLFTVARINALRDEIQRVVDESLDRFMAEGNTGDFFEGFALTIPSLIICRLMGVPYEHHDFFQKAARDRMDLRVSSDAPVKAGKELGDFLRKMLEEMLTQEDPGDHLMGRLVQDQVKPGNLDLEDAVAICRLLLIAGHETTANAITYSMLSLLCNPDQLQLLRDHPDLMPVALEELLRYTSVPQYLPTRVAIEDVELGGQLVRAGEGVIGPLGAGNRDPEVFEDPDKLDLQRTPNHHIVFADGIHQCIGQPLARLEMNIALTTVIRRMPNLALAVPLSELDFRHEQRAYGVHSLPVTW
jgi:cytochrome P450